MIETSLTPSPLLRTVATVARWVLWLLASAWLVLAMVWAGLHFLIVPRIAELRPWLEQHASQVLGIPLRIGTVAARTNGLIPSIEFAEVQLLDAQGRTALRLPSVQVALSPRSVFGGGLEQLYIDSPVLEVRRTVDGQLWVAGLLVSSGPSAESPALDWLFDQFELAIRHGTVTWTDELRGAPPLTLTDVDWVLRNRHHSHAMRLDFTPSVQWGERITAAGVFKQPLLSRHAGRWQEWTGQIYVDFSHIELNHLRRYADIGVDVEHGTGAVRAWLEVQRGRPTAATVDLALKDVQVGVAEKLEDLQFRWAAGRLGVRAVDGGYEFSTRALEFDTGDGLHWPGGNLRLAWFQGDARNPPRGNLEADRLDFAALAQIAQRLPVGDAWHGLLAGLRPRGLVKKLEGSWQGPPEKPVRYAVKGRIEQMEVAADPNVTGKRPGFRGLDLDFDLTQAGGTASFNLNGQLLAPVTFDEPELAFDLLKGDLQWKRDGAQTSLSVTNVHFANADAQGEFQGKWHSAGSDASPLGGLDLTGSLSRAELNRVYRYLPTGIDKGVRDYVRDAVHGGSGSSVRFKVKGGLDDFPFTDPRTGEFRIAAELRNASYSYVPSSVLPKGSLPWPSLAQVSADFLIDRNSLSIKSARAVTAGTGSLQIVKADSVVSNLYSAAQLAVSAEGRGLLADMVGLVNGSPLGEITSNALAQANATGLADFRFKLALPLANPDRATVQGSLTLAGNDLQVRPDTPRLARARGAIAFSDTGFSVTGVQARALGGDVRIEGGLNTKVPTQLMRIQGSATAEGLGQARELGLVARLAEYGSGAATYSATLGLRAGVAELQVSTNLAGMALNLPEPFSKTAQDLLPLRLETSGLRSNQDAVGTSTPALHDQLLLEVGTLASVRYVRDVSGPEAKVLRGAIGVGLAADESAVMPERGVAANIQVGLVDVDAWTQVLSHSSEVPVGTVTASPGGLSLAQSYLPSTLVVRAKTLAWGGRKFNQVLAGGGRDGLLWRANMDATELNGYVEYRQSLGPQAGRLYARLARLSVAPSAAQDMENILDEQPASIPAMDIVVEDCELRGKKLGRVDIEAVNLGASGGKDANREWRLNRFDITTPEASLKASGNWTDVVSLTEPVAGKSIKERRRTAMKFALEISDAGALLERFGMPGVLRKGEGKIEGRVGWMGSPITLDYASMGGNFNVNVETGQFLKADPGIAKLLGVLSLQSLPRRLALDFRDVFTEGFSFDFLRGDVAIEHGIAHTNNLQMKGVNAAVLMEGQADIAKETQSIKVLVVPEINAGSASLIASTINPLIGLSTFLAQWILRKPLMDAATQEFLVDGTWVDPRVTKVDHQTAPTTPTKEQK